MNGSVKLSATLFFLVMFANTCLAAEPDPHIGRILEVSAPIPVTTRPVSALERERYATHAWMQWCSQSLSVMRREGKFAEIKNVACSIHVNQDYLFDNIRIIRSSKSAHIDRLATELLTLKKPLSRTPFVKGKAFRVDFNEPNTRPNNNCDDVKITLVSKF